MRGSSEKEKPKKAEFCGRKAALFFALFAVALGALGAGMRKAAERECVFAEETTVTVRYENAFAGENVEDLDFPKREKRRVGEEIYLPSLNRLDGLDGKRYALIGWTLERRPSPKDYVVEEEGGYFNSYTVAAEDAERETGEIVLYAVWAHDDNGDNFPDWGETFYITCRNGAGGRVSGKTALPTSALAGMSGEAVRLAFDCALEKDGKRYALAGWTLSEGEHLCEPKREDFIPKGGTYTVFAGDAQNGTVFISLYAVWEIDENGNGIPDDEEVFTAVFEGGGAESAALPARETVKNGGLVLGGDPKNAAVSGINYVFLGWTALPGRYLFTAAPETMPPLLSFPYALRADDPALFEGEIVFYAVWGVDRNENGLPDYEERFTVVYRDAVSASAMPAAAEDLPLGGSIGALPSLSIFANDRDFVLIGWTTKAENDTKRYLWRAEEGDPRLRYRERYGEAFYSPNAGRPYLVAAEDAGKNGIITLYAVWAEDENGNGLPDCDEEKFTVTFETNADVGFESVERFGGDTLDLPSEGKTSVGGTNYILIGWKEEEGNHFYGEPQVEFIVGTFSVEKTVTLYAVWAEDCDELGAGDGIADYTQTYTVVFESEEDAILPERHAGLKPGEALRLPNSLSIRTADYILLGWKIEDTSDLLTEEYQISARDALGGIITLHAVWAEDENGNGMPDRDELRYTVKFETNTDVSFESAERFGGDTLNLPSEGKTSVDGVNYILIGWTEEEGRHFYDEPQIEFIVGTFRVEKSVTLYAVWAEDCDELGAGDGIPDYTQAYTVVFESEKDTTLPNRYSGMKSGETLRLPDSLTVRATNYVLLGWKKDKDSDLFTEEYCVKSRDAVSGIITLHAVWAEDENGNETPDFNESRYTVKFETNADVSFESVERFGGDMIVLPSEGKASVGGVNYILIGWTEEVGRHFYGEPQLDFICGAYRAEKNVTLYAVWTEDCDELGKGDGIADYTETYTVEFASDKDTTLPERHAGMKSGETLRLPDHLTVRTADYVLLGWKKDKETSDFLTEEYHISARDSFGGIITLHAVWAEDENGNGTPDRDEEKFTVTFETNAEVRFESAERFGGDTLVLPSEGRTEVGGTNYILIGWTEEEGAHFFEKPSIKFIKAGEVFTFIKTVTLYAVWAEDCDELGKGDGIADYMQTYTVEFESEKDTNLPERHAGMKSGETLRLPDSLSVRATGHILLGWTKEKNTSDLFTEEYCVKSSDAVSGIITLHAVWTEDENGNGTPDFNESSYTVTFETNAEVSFESVERFDGDALNLPSEGRTTVDGTNYILIGWTEEAGAYFFEKPSIKFIKSGEAFTVEKNVTLYAVWAEDCDELGNGDGIADYIQTYTVEFESDKEASLPNRYSGMKSGETLRLPDSLSVRATNYVLLGWMIKNTSDLFAEEYCVKSCDALGGVITLHAVWAEDENGNGLPDRDEEKFTVTFETNAEVSFESAERFGGDTLVLPSEGKTTVGGTNYILIGWTEEEGRHFYGEPQVEFIVGTFRVEKSVALYSVWAEDCDELGAGDGIADYIQTYTVVFESEKDTILPDRHAGMKFGDTLRLPDHLSVRAANYVLLGWKIQGSTELITDEYYIFTRDAVSGVITLHAVWAEDENGNGTPDRDEEKFTVTFETNAEVSFESAERFGGDMIVLPSKGQTSVNGTNYILVGWTEEKGKHFYGEPQLDFICGAYRAEKSVILYAVWAEDCDELGNGDGIADYTQTYTVVFESEKDTTLPNRYSGLKSGETLRLPDSLSVRTANYVLLGWKIKETSDLLTEEYHISVRDAVGGIITLYAVWAEDENGNGLPDRDEEKFTVTFETNAEVSFESVERFDGDKIVLPSEGKTTVGGTNYILIGWTEEAGKHFYGEPQVEFIVGTFSVEKTVTLYAVWAEDCDELGAGDGIADYTQTYTVVFESEKDTTLPNRYSGLKSGETLRLPDSLSVRATNYVLLGWKMQGATELLVDEYCISARAAHGGVITLHAVWAEDENGNGLPDRDESRYTVTFETSADGVNFESAERFGGDTLDLPSEGKTSVGGINYILVGWTEQAGRHFYRKPQIDFIGGTFSVEKTVTLYAVWAEDCDELGAGDGIADYTQTYTVVFESDKDTILPERHAGMKTGETLRLPNSLSVRTADYVLLGWMIKNTSDLFAEEYCVKSCDALGGVITLHAVWAEDENGNGLPDRDESRYTVKFETNADVSFESAERFGGDTLDLPNEGQTSVNGVNYILIGWTEEEGAHFFEKPSIKFIKAGEVFTVIKTVTLYAVWAEDCDELGNGDGIADYTQTYTVVFESEEDAILPERHAGMKSGETLRLPNSLSVRAANNILLGWQKDKDSDLLTEEYCVKSRDAVKGIITLHAVWSADCNGNRIPDRDEVRRTVRFILPDLTSEVREDGEGRPLLVGITVFPPAVEREYVAENGMRYVFLGWSKRGEDLFLTREEELLSHTLFRDFYTVAEEDGETVSLYAVWGADENGNGTPDFKERFTLLFADGNGVLFGCRRDLRAGERVALGSERAERAVFLGWTLTFGEHRYTQEPPVEVMTDFYTVALADASDGVITLYAVWGADENGNGVPDRKDLFTVRFEQRAKGTAVLPPDITAAAGETVFLPAEGVLTEGGRRYALVGWTRSAFDGCGYLYTEAPEKGPERLCGEAYCVSAADAEGLVICFYAVWGIDENGDGVADWAEKTVSFFDPLSLSFGLPADVPAAGNEVALKALLPKAGANVEFLGWTEDRSLAECVRLSAAGLYSDRYPVSASAAGLIKLYAVWGICAELGDRTYGESPRLERVTAERAERGTLLFESARQRREVSVDGDLKEAILSASERLPAGEWTLSAGGRLLSRFEVFPRALSLSGVAVRCKRYDGTVRADADLSRAVLFGALPSDDVRLNCDYVTAMFADPGAGVKSASVTGFLLEGKDAENYYLAEETVSAEAMIERAPLAWESYFAALDKTYDGTAKAEVVFGDGWLAGYDLFVEACEAQFENGNAGKEKRVYVHLRLGGGDAENVSLGEIVLFADILRAENEWIAEYGEGLPAAKWCGQRGPRVEFFLDADCTQTAEGYGDAAFVRVTVDETENWTGLCAIYRRTGGEPAPEERSSAPFAAALWEISASFVAVAAVAAVAALIVRKRKKR